MSNFIDETKINEEFVFFKDIFASKTNHVNHKQFKKFLRENENNINEIMKAYNDVFAADIDSKSNTGNDYELTRNKNKLILGLPFVLFSGPVVGVIYLFSVLFSNFNKLNTPEILKQAGISVSIMIGLGLVLYGLKRIWENHLKNENEAVNRLALFGTENPDNPNNLLTDIRIDPINDEEIELLQDYEKPGLG